MNFSLKNKPYDPTANTQNRSFVLTNDQRDLLMAALDSRNSSSNETLGRNMNGTSSAQITNSHDPHSGLYDLSYGDEAFNTEDNSNLFDDLDDEEEQDDVDGLHQKRKSIDGQDEDDEGGGKRREGEKEQKKPGRKPIMSEPTTKRKAQNRAAQRAFRDRKEKHLKDLETKVTDLEKQSELTNQENALLKAKLERTQVEVREYRKRLSWISNNGTFRPQSQNANNASNDFNFQFPKFGNGASSAGFDIISQPGPGVSQPSAAQMMPETVSLSQIPSQSKQNTSIQNKSTNSFSPIRSLSSSNAPVLNMNSVSSPTTYNDPPNQGNPDSYEALFSPEILRASLDGIREPYSNMLNNAQAPAQNRASKDHSNGSIPGLSYGSSMSNTESPSSTCDSQNHVSSLNTSPEPNLNTPQNKLFDHNLAMFGGNTNNSYITNNFQTYIPQPENSLKEVDAFDPNFNFTSDTDLSFLTASNGTSAFDPVLFGDYRDTQNDTTNQDFHSFFNDAFPLPDLGTPSHNFDNTLSKVSTIQAPGQMHPTAQVMMGGDTLFAPDLMSKVDAMQSGEDQKPKEAPRLMTCNKIWDRLQSMEKFRNGEIDIDSLCTQLKAKARCSEGGAAVEESHVNQILGL